MTPTTDSGGIYGLDRGTPLQRGVGVYSIVLTYSNAGTAGASQIYSPISYTGKLLMSR